MPISITPRAFLRALIVWGLVAFFLVGSVANVLAMASVRADYDRWGYPDGFHYLTGLIEFAAALLLAREATRKRGAAVGGVAMTGALVTLLLHGEIAHAAAPVVVMLAIGACLMLDAKAREVRWECKVF